MSPTAGSRRSGNLPSTLTTFVGRRREATGAKRLLAESRLVTFIGIGGVGKTRLALRVADDVRRDFPDGAWFVDLAELHDPGLVPDTVAAVFGLHDQAAQSPARLLIDHLAGRSVLLVLDSCEHLLDSAAKLVDELLRECPGVRIVATSREPLGVGGEAVLRVPPLPVPDPEQPPGLEAMPRYESVTLFAERARAAVPDFAVTEANRETVARICHRLDGLPLPIELAAARLRALSLDQILERLTDRYRILTAGSRVAPTRLQTLRLSVDWSYELCTVQERRLWSRLAVFSGGFELDAAEGICADEPGSDNTLDLVASLVDKSILTVETSETGVRYGMLETLRDYGQEKLDESGACRRFRSRHRDWYLGLVEHAEAHWVGPRQPETIARLIRDRANLRDALEFSVTEDGEGERGLRMANALYPFWFCLGMLGEGRYWLARALAASDPGPDRTRILALCAASQLAGMQEDFAAGTALVAEAGHLAAEIGDPVVDALVRNARGRQALYRGELAEAIGHFERAVGPLRSLSDPHRLVLTLQGLGLVAGMSGDVELARSCHEEVLAITRPRGEVEYRARAMFLLGLTLWRQGSHDRAGTLFAEALALAVQVGDRFAGAGCLESAAWAAARVRDGERATVLSGAAESMRQAMGVPPVMIPTMHVFHQECRALCHSLLGDRAFDGAFARGAALDFPDAVDYALSRDDASGLTTPEMDAPTAPMRIVVPPTDGPALTRRERQVAELVGQGMTNREIAENLVISQRTAEGHVERVLAKLGFGSRTQIAAWVAEQHRA